MSDRSHARLQALTLLALAVALPSGADAQPVAVGALPQPTLKPPPSPQDMAKRLQKVMNELAEIGQLIDIDDGKCSCVIISPPKPPDPKLPPPPPPQPPSSVAFPERSDGAVARTMKALAFIRSKGEGKATAIEDRSRP